MFYFALQVYDVTKFLEEHPGGDDVLLSATGTEFLGLTYFSNNLFEDFI
jgi:cytochrome b involved in lipid metabolism